MTSSIEKDTQKIPPIPRNVGRLAKGTVCNKRYMRVGVIEVRDRQCENVFIPLLSIS